MIKDSFIKVTKCGITGENVYNLMVIVEKEGYDLTICHSTFRNYEEATEAKSQL